MRWGESVLGRLRPEKRCRKSWEEWGKSVPGRRNYMCKGSESRESIMHPCSFVNLELMNCRQPGGKIRQKPFQQQLELELYPRDTGESLKVLNRGIHSGFCEQGLGLDSPGDLGT